MNITSVSDQLLETAARYMSEWGLRDDGPPETTESCLVVPVKAWKSTLATLKIYEPEAKDQAVDEIEALRFYCARGSFRLYREDLQDGVLLVEDFKEDKTEMPLLERAAFGQDEFAFARICNVARTFRMLPIDTLPLNHPFKPFSSLADRLRSVDGGSLHKFFQGAAETLGEIEAAYPITSLLHGNLLFDNVEYRRHHRCWLAKNPRPLLGPGPYDLTTAITGPWDPQNIYLDLEFYLDRERMKERILQAADSAKFSQKLMAKTVFARAAVNALGSLGEEGSPTNRGALDHWVAIGKMAVRIEYDLG